MTKLSSSLFYAPAFFFYVIPIFLFSIPTASSLKIMVSPTSTVNASVTVYWVPEANDPPDFDLRFVENGQDVGLAKANINITSAKVVIGEDIIVFPRIGAFVLKAVSGPAFTVIGTSNTVNVIAPITKTQTTTAAAAPTDPISVSPSPSPSPAASSSSSKSPNKASIIVGGIVGALLLGVLIGVLLIFLMRRRRLHMEDNRNKHLSFHGDDMVQRRSRMLRASVFGQGVDRAVTIVRGAPVAVENGSQRGIPQVRFSLASTVSRNSTIVTGSAISGSMERDLEAAAQDAGTFLHLPSGGPRPKVAVRPLPPIPVGAAFPADAFASRSPSPVNAEEDEEDECASNELQVPASSAAASSSVTLPTFTPGVPSRAAVALTPTRFLPFRAPRTERQQHMDGCIRQLKEQIGILDNKVARDDIEQGVGKRVKHDLQRQVAWLEKNVEGRWAKGEENVLPIGFSRYMMP